MQSYEQAARRYRPDQIEVLFVAESPPAFASPERRSYFFFESVPGKDVLFATIVKAVFDVDYRKAGGSKAALLQRLKDEGFWLVDAVAEPINRAGGRAVRARERERLIAQAAQDLLTRLEGLKREGVLGERAGLILIKKSVHRVLYPILAARGYRLLNGEKIDFPKYFRDRDTVAGIRAALRQTGRALSFDREAAQDRTLASYERDAAALARRYEGADMSTLYETACARFRPRGRVLELGCGSGRDAAALLARGFDVVAADGSKAMLAAAAAQHPELEGRLHLVELPAPAPFPAGSFDAVLSVAALMHLDRAGIRATLADIARLLRPGGKLLFSVPGSRGGLDPRGIDERGRRFTMLPAGEWEALGAAAGLELLSTSRSSDGLGRKDVSWLFFLFRKPPL